MAKSTLTDSEKSELYHLKRVPTNTRARKMLCGYSDPRAIWSAWNYIKYHINKKRWCPDCIAEMDYICDECGHYDVQHERKKCLLANCNCKSV